MTGSCPAVARYVRFVIFPDETLDLTRWFLCSHELLVFVAAVARRAGPEHRACTPIARLELLPVPGVYLEEAAARGPEELAFVNVQAKPLELCSHRVMAGVEAIKELVPPCGGAEQEPS